MAKKKHNYKDYDEWFDKYKPIKNKLVKDASWNGCLFETYGEEEEYVRKVAQDEAAEIGGTVWTIVEDDYGFLCVIPGWHYVNRIGYLVTKKPWGPKEEAWLGIYDADDIQKVLRRERNLITKK
jgi:hypothetical protein